MQSQETGSFNGTFADYFQQRTTMQPDTLLIDAEAELLAEEEVRKLMVVPQDPGVQLLACHFSWKRALLFARLLSLSAAQYCSRARDSLGKHGYLRMSAACGRAHGGAAYLHVAAMKCWVPNICWQL